MNSTELIDHAWKRESEVDYAPSVSAEVNWVHGYIQGWMDNLKHEDKRVAGQVLEDILAERDALQAENKRLKERVAELEAFAEPILRTYESGSNTAQDVRLAEGKEAVE